jgi:hypothetical protein
VSGEAPQKRGWFRTLLRVFEWGTLGVILLVAVGVYFFYNELRPKVIFGLRQDFAQAIPLQKVPAGLLSLKAEECGKCHREIYEEWKSSYHAQAYSDPFFRAYWKKDGEVWICLNCHTPLANQQPELITEVPRNRVERAVKAPNPDYDQALQQEGVTCAGCHVRDGVILGPFDDSVAPHPTQFDPRFRTTEICYRCHQVPKGPFQFYNVGPCGTFPEYEGTYFARERGLICQSCHMPEIERPMAEGGPIRRGRQHLWRGGHDPEQIKSALAVQLAADPPQPHPGQPMTFTLTLINAGAGHKLPTGDPDRYFTVGFRVVDGTGRVVKEQADSMGRWILWQPVIVELYDNRLPPLASRDYRFTYRMPGSSDATAGLKLQVMVRYHILTDKAYKTLKTSYGLQGDHPYSFAIYEREVPLSGPLSAEFIPLGSPRAGAASCSQKG